MTNEPENNKCNTPPQYKAIEGCNHNLEFDVKHLVALQPIKFLKSEIEEFRYAFSGYRYTLEDDGDYYIASNFVSYKDAAIPAFVASCIANKIDFSKPFKSYEPKAKHQKHAAQKAKECATRRSKNKQPKQRKK